VEIIESAKLATDVLLQQCDVSKDTTADEEVIETDMDAA
jgi:hypothetical protein